MRRSGDPFFIAPMAADILAAAGRAAQGKIAANSGTKADEEVAGSASMQHVNLLRALLLINRYPKVDFVFLKTGHAPYICNGQRKSYMNWFGTFLTSSIGKKFVMGLTGISLVLFLLVHCGINALIFANDGGVLFNKAAHFMGTNIIIRTMEIGLFGGILLHIVQAYILAAGNAKSRPSKYQVNNASANSRWYSRSMTLLGTLILLFLIIHLKHFWVVSRFIGLEETSYGAENLYIEMQEVFANLWVVIVYLLGVISLAWHLVHGFQSAFQTLGLNQQKYKALIRNAGWAYSIVISLLFALMPVAMYLEWVK